MAFEFRLPDIGEGLVEGEIVKWLVSEGDHVEEDQPIVEVMTDKATVEISSPRTGVILKQLYGDGSVVAVEAVFVVIGEADENVASIKTAKSSKSAQATDNHKVQPIRPEVSLPTTKSKNVEKTVERIDSPMMMPPIPHHRVLATPGVRKFAMQKGINLNQVQGSGPYGRVLKTDIEQGLNGSSATAVAVGPGHYETRGGHTREIPLRGLRKRIAAQMVRAKTHAPHFTYVEEVDMSPIVALRKELKPVMDKRKVNLTYLPFVVKAAIEGLKAYPLVNASLDEAREVVVIKEHYHIGIAVASADGLVVPVIKNADRMDVWQIATEIIRLATAVREKKIKSSELQDSTFTLTSIGNIGGILATPILNYPEAGIMGVNKVREVPVVRDGQITIGHTMYLSNTFDHRVVDGDIAARFTKVVVEQLQSPKALLSES